MRISIISILLLLGTGLPVWATPLLSSPCTPLLKTYSKSALIGAIHHARNAAITVEVGGELRQSVGIPQEQDITPRSVCADISELAISIKEFEKLISYTREEEEARQRQAEKEAQEARQRQAEKETQEARQRQAEKETQEAEYANLFVDNRVRAMQGEARAQAALGGSYEIGLGVPRDNVEAAKWYRKAAEQGEAGAQMLLGGMYYHGRGVPQDDVEAAKWYRKAAEQGKAGAQPRSS